MSTFDPQQSDLLRDTAAVIIAGGSGTRFWPLSSENRPKQFLALFGERTMLQETCARLHGIVVPNRIVVVTNRKHVASVRKQLPEVPAENVVGEPVAKDTAAAVTLGALICRLRFGNPVMAVLPADHYISPVEAFRRTLQSAMSAARNGSNGCKRLYTIGITPTYPAIGYGYLLRGERIREDDGMEHFRVKAFKEKPDVDTARRYLESGNCFWNSGMFVWTADDLLARVEEFLPQHAENLSRAIAYYGSPQWRKALERAMEPLAKISIDFGVMEKADNVCMVKAGFAWSDVGSWPALAQYMEKDRSGNATRGRVECLDASNNLVFSDNQREIVALVGVHDLVVVRCRGMTLVVHRDRAEDVKKIVARM